jgi:hypothetical protein
MDLRVAQAISEPRYVEGIDGRKGVGGHAATTEVVKTVERMRWIYGAGSMISTTMKYEA